MQAQQNVWKRLRAESAARAGYGVGGHDPLVWLSLRRSKMAISGAFDTARRHGMRANGGIRVSSHLPPRT
ncbi:hypothetical protein PSP6_640026 [Paraburkholderia tropica]|nr:hypothetical protein PSP6_640026 [Paraburkholderia tropica]